MSHPFWSIGSRCSAGSTDWRSPPWFFPKQGHAGIFRCHVRNGHPLFGISGSWRWHLREHESHARPAVIPVIPGLSVAASMRAWLSLAASVAGAAFFAFNYPKFAQLPHIQLRFDMLQPIILGLLLSLLISREVPSQPRTFLTCLGAALAFALLAGTTFLNAWFLALLLLVFFAVALLISRAAAAIFSLPAPTLARSVRRVPPGRPRTAAAVGPFSAGARRNRRVAVARGAAENSPAGCSSSGWEQTISPGDGLPHVGPIWTRRTGRR